ncbi:hypothetical protein FOZ63_006096, partial [Perkinsus olseni]
MSNDARQDTEGSLDLRKRTHDNADRVKQYRGLYGDLDPDQSPSKRRSSRDAGSKSPARRRGRSRVDSEAASDRFDADRALLVFNAPSSYKDHMKFLTEHMENFETGTAGPTNVKLAALLGQSLAFMNAALDAQSTPTLLGDETLSSARAAVKNGLPRFKAAMDHIGRQRGTVRKRKAYTCLRLLYDKLTRFAAAQPYSGINRVRGRKSVKYQTDQHAIKSLLSEYIKPVTSKVTDETAGAIVGHFVEAFGLPYNLMCDAEETVRRA